MIRIVGLQRNSQVDREFVLLQNQGSMRINLRGHIVVSESAFLSGVVGEAFHSFTEDITVAPGQFIVLFSGFGENRWAKSKDGSIVYHAYMGRPQAVWEHAVLPLHTMGVQHTYQERVEPSLLLR